MNRKNAPLIRRAARCSLHAGNAVRFSRPRKAGKSRKPTPIVEYLDEPIEAAGQCVDLNGRPCVLFADWDYGQGWSGEFVRDVHPFVLLKGRDITRDEFWTLV